MTITSPDLTPTTHLDTGAAAVLLTVDAELNGKQWAEVFRAVKRDRNVVREMVATLRAIKPARAPLRALQKQTLVRFVTVG